MPLSILKGGIATRNLVFSEYHVMSIGFSCPKCGRSLSAPAGAVGKIIPCPTCGQMIGVPAGSAGGTPPPLPQGTAGPQPWPQQAPAGRTRSKTPLILACVGGGVLLVVAVVVGVILFSGSGLSQAARYLPDDSNLVVSINLSSVVKSKLYQKLEKEGHPQFKKMLQEMKDEGGLVPADLSRLTVGLDVSGGDEPIVVLELNRAIDTKEMLEKMKKGAGGDFKEEQYGGATVHVGGKYAVHFPDKRTIVFGPGKVLRAVLERKGPPAASAKAQAVLKMLDSSKSVSLAAVFPDKAPTPMDLPFPLPEEAAAVLTSVRSASVHANVGSDQLSATLTFKDEDTAKKAQESIEEMRKEAEKDEAAPPELRAVVKSLKVSRSGPTISAQVTISEELMDKGMKTMSGPEGGMDMPAKAPRRDFPGPPRRRP